MPEKRGRKRRARERRHAEPAASRSAEPPMASEPARGEATSRQAPGDLPRLRVRMAGFVLGVITMFIGILNVVSGIGGGSIVYLITGVLLIVLAIVLGVLTLVPERVRALLSRE